MFLLIVIVVLLAFLAPSQKNKATKAVSKILDDNVTVELVTLYLEGFKPSVIAGRKNGFTEKDVQDELEVHLKKYFHSVSREYAIEGKNVKRIDFDIGNGRVGIEVKLAESLLKEGEGDRVIGQVLKYTNRKYNAQNLIIAVAGFQEHTNNTVIHEMKEFVRLNKAHFIFLKGKR